MKNLFMKQGWLQAKRFCHRLALLIIYVSTLCSLKAQSNSSSLAPPWVNQDIGNPALPGSASQTDGTYSLTGSGQGIDGRADEFHFVYLPMAGDGEIIARISSVEPGAMAGLMIRKSLRNSSPNVSFLIDSEDQATFKSRGHDGGTTISKPSDNYRWLKLAKEGVILSAYGSTDGSQWTLARSQSFSNLTEACYFGLVVSNGDVTELSNATFSDVVINGATTIPDAPSGLQATQIETSNITLSWSDNADNETGFKLERSLSEASGFIQIADLASGVTSYEDTELEAGTVYFYRLSAYNDNGSSGYAIISAQTNPTNGLLPAPWLNTDIGEPTLAGSASYGNQTFSLAGSGQGIDGRADEFHFVYLPMAGDGEIIARISSVEPGAMAGITIRKSMRNSSPNVSFLIDSEDQATFKSRGHDGGTTVSKPSDNYRWLKLAKEGVIISAYGSTDGSQWTLARSQSFSKLTGVCYFGLVVSNGDVTELSNATFSEVVVSEGSMTPAAPSALAALSIETTSITLGWSDNSDNESGFTVERSEGDANDFEAIANVASGVTSFTDENLNAATTYHYRVRAYNSFGSSAYTATITAATAELLIPAAPSALAALSIETTSITLGWSDNSDNESGFTVERSEGDANDFEAIANVASGVTSFTDENLNAATTYHYRVRAYNSFGSSAYTTTVTAATAELSIPAAPSGLTAQALSASRVLLDWSNNADHADGIKVERSINSDLHFEEIADLGSELTRFEDIGLEPGNTYFYRVQAYNDKGASTYSATARATTDELIAQLPQPWTSEDVGTSAIPGAAYYSGGTFTIVANGKEFHGNSDEFHYIYQEVVDDHEIIAQVESLDGGDVNAFAGIMVRGSIANNDAHGTIGFTNNSEMKWKSRDSERGGTLQRRTPSPKQWVRLVKTDQTITGYTSPDGEAWELFFAREKIKIGAKYYVGLVVNSDSPDAISTGVFSNVTVRPFLAQPTAPSELIAVQGLSGSLRLSWMDNAYNETAFLVERSLLPNTGFQEIATLNTGVITYLDTDVRTGNTYYYRVRAANESVFSEYTAVAEATNEEVARLLPEPWQHTDVGEPAMIGSAGYDDGTFYLWGAGTNISGRKDEFHFAHRPLLRNGVITVKIDRLTGVGEETKAGIMVRESLSGTETRMFLIGGSTSKVRNYVTRSRDLKRGGTHGQGKGIKTELPFWVRVIKDGTFFTGFYSFDGVNWTEEYTRNVPMDEEVFAGLFVNSNNPSLLSRADFSDFSIQQIPTPGTPRTLTTEVNDLQSEVSLKWRDHSVGETGFIVERSTDPEGGFEVIANLEPNTQSYMDRTAPSTLCHYRVKAYDTNGESAYSNLSSLYVGSLPQPWFSKSVGYEAAGDTAVFKDHVYTILSRGKGLTGNSDEFHYLCQYIVGDGEIVVKMNDLAATDNSANAGIMLRESLDPDAKAIAIGVAANGDLLMQQRRNTGANSTSTIGDKLDAPGWLRLVRAGDEFTTFYSNDGVSWQEAQRNILNMSDEVYIGVMVASGDINQQMRGAFEQLTVRSITQSQVLNLFRWAGDYDKTDLGNVIRVTTTPDTVNRRNTCTGMLGKTIAVDLAQPVRANNATLSFKFIPDHLDHSVDLLVANNIKFHLEKEELSVWVGNEQIVADLPVSYVICNHAALRLSTKSISFYFNGEWKIIPNTNSFVLNGITLNDYAGQTWDVQLYDGLLTAFEVNQISRFCLPEADISEFAPEKHKDHDKPYTQAICGSYKCLWATEDVDLMQDRFLYHIWQSDQTFEYFTFRAGMYIHGRMEESILNYANPRTFAVTPYEDYIDGDFDNPKMENPGFGAYGTHEAFHGFQGFYPGNNNGGKWIFEATANWGASFFYDNLPVNSSSSITMYPHLPAIYYNKEDYLAPNGKRDYHSYILLNYITRFVSNPFFIGKMFNYPNFAQDQLLGMRAILAEEGHDFAEVFMEYAARTTTWDYVDGSGPLWKQSEEEQINGLIADGYKDFNFKFSQIMDETGTSDVMTAIPEALRPGVYSWNAYKVATTVGGSYTIRLKGITDNPEGTVFKAQVITGTTDNYQYHDLPVSEAVAFGDAEAQIEVSTVAGEELILVVASVPDTYTDPIQPRYAYEYAIAGVASAARAGRNLLSIADFDKIPYPNGSDGRLTIELSRDYQIEEVVITDLNGRQLPVHYTQEGTRLNLSFEGAEGMYRLQLTSPMGSQSFKIIKE